MLDYNFGDFEQSPRLDPPSYETQVGVLDDTQDMHRSVLAPWGVFELAAEIAQNLDEETAFFHSSLRQHVSEISNGLVMKISSVVLTEFSLDDEGRKHTHPRFVVVARTIAGKTYPSPYFGNPEALRSVELLSGLEQLKNEEILPDLDPTLTHIKPPGTRSISIPIQRYN